MAAQQTSGTATQKIKQWPDIEQWRLLSSLFCDHGSQNTFHTSVSHFTC